MAKAVRKPITRNYPDAALFEMSRRLDKLWNHTATLDAAALKLRRAGKLAKAKRLTAESTMEQASAGLDALTDR